MSRRGSEKSSKQRSGIDDSDFYAECKATYLTLYKSISERVMQKSDLVALLVTSGRSPSLKNIDLYWPKNTEFLSYSQFCAVMRSEKPISKLEAIEILSKLDTTDSGLLREQELVKVLTQFGEKMTSDEVEDILSDIADCYRGEDIDYVKLANKITVGPPELIPRDKGSPRPNSRSSISSKLSKDEKQIQKRFLKIQPKGLSEWKSTSLRGTLIFNEHKNIVSNTYTLDLESTTSIFMTIEPKAVGSQAKQDFEVLVMCIKETDDKLSTDISISDQFDGQKFCLKKDLVGGKYRLIPFTFNKLFAPRKGEGKKKKLTVTQNDVTLLSEECKQSLSDLFQMIDVNCDGGISRDEFGIFQLHVGGDEVDDDAWETVESNFDVKDNSITLKGFLDMHAMEASDAPDELWMTLTSYGFNGSLILDEACPFDLCIYSESGNSPQVTARKSIELVESVVKEKLIQFCQLKGKDKVKSGITTSTWSSNQIGMATIRNDGKEWSKVKVDISKSGNVSETTLEKEVERLAPDQSDLTYFCVAKDWNKSIDLVASSTLLQ